MYGWLSLWSLFGSLLKYGTYYLGYPKRDPNFDNYPYEGCGFGENGHKSLGFRVTMKGSTTYHSLDVCFFLAVALAVACSTGVGSMVRVASGVCSMQAYTCVMHS